MSIHCSKRPSGADCLIERMSCSHSVTVGFWFPIGSGIESENERGFSHFIEHMMFKGTLSRDALSLAREAERAGGYLNAFTERSCLCIHCTIPASNWRVAVALLGDMAFHSIFSLQDFLREKAVVQSEALAAKDDPDEDSTDEFHARIWKGHPLSGRVAGEPEEIERIGRDELFSFYEKHFVPENLLVSAAGNFDIAEMEEALDAALENLPAGERTAMPAPPVYQSGKWVHSASTGQVYLVAGSVVPKSLSKEELHAMDVLNCAFGESSSSRLFQNIRENNGLCYSIGSSFASADSFGVFYISAACEASAFGRLWGMIRKELDDLKKNGLTNGEVDDAVAHIYGQDLVAADDTDVRMRALARHWLRFGYSEPYMRSIKGIRSVDGRKVRDARDILFTEPISVLVYGKVSARVERTLGDV